MKKFMKEPIIVGLAMFRLFTLLSLFIFGLNSSCKGQNFPSNINGNALNMELVLQDDYSNVVTEEVLLIKNQESLQSFFSKINKTRKPGLPVPDINFDEDMVFVWCQGETLYPGIDLLLQKETKEAYIFKKTYTSGKRENTAILSPFLLYKLPISAKNIIVE